MIIIPNVNKENSCLDCPVWSLCWDNKPTEDICKDRCPIVEPKYGHWIEKIIYSHSYAECSECKTVYSWSETETMRFCKRCGAYMRGQKDDK